MRTALIAGQAVASKREHDAARRRPDFAQQVAACLAPDQLLAGTLTAPEPPGVIALPDRPARRQVQALITDWFRVVRARV